MPVMAQDQSTEGGVGEVEARLSSRRATCRRNSEQAMRNGTRITQRQRCDAGSLFGLVAGAVFP
jgi:hypothetical protein